MANDFIRIRNQLLAIGSHDVENLQRAISNHHRLLAIAVFDVYQSAQNPDVRILDMAITCMETLMNTGEGAVPASDSILYSKFLQTRYKQLGQMKDLEACISYTAAACEKAQLRAANYPAQAEWLCDLANHLSTRYQQTRSLKDLEDAINRLEAAIALTPDNHPDCGGRLRRLGDHFHTQYEHTGNLNHLQAAISNLEAALASTSQDPPSPLRVAILNNLGLFLTIRYGRTRDIEDSKAAITTLEAALEATPTEDYTKQVPTLGNLAFCFQKCYQQTGNMEDLEAAITHSERAVGLIPEDHPGRAAQMNNLGNHLISRYQRSGNFEDLRAAIIHLEAAVALTPDSHPDREIRLSNLGCHFTTLYEYSGKIDDLETAISHLEAALALISEDHPDRAIRLNNLGIAFSAYYKQTGNLDNLETAITHSEVAVALTPEDHPVRATRLNNLGNQLASRYERTWNINDLETAITHLKAAVALTPEDHPDRAGRLNNLGGQFKHRYEQSGNFEDLETAISYLETSLEMTPEDHKQRLTQLDTLSICLGIRYRRTGNSRDLDTAITLLEAAIEATPKTHIALARRLDILGNYLSTRYKRTENVDDLEAAIAQSKEALGLTAGDHPDRAVRLTHLGNHFSQKYVKSGDPKDLNTATSHLEAAVKITPKDSPFRTFMLSNLGLCLNDQYRETENLGDLEAAISHLEAAVKSIPEGHPDQAQIYNNCGVVFMDYADALGDNSPLSVQATKQALAALCSSWNTSSARILPRLRGAFAAAKLLVFNSAVKDLSRAGSLLKDAVNLMPLATSRSIDREDQQYILKTLPGMASLATSVLLETEESPLKACMLLELGRNVTNSQLLDYRSGIPSSLMNQHPTLAQDFDSLRCELDSPFPPLEFSGAWTEKGWKIQQAAIRRRNKVAQDLEHTLHEIRQKAGFENFLRAESKEYLLAAAQQGPIAVLNVTKLRSDAILITMEEVRSLTLPMLSHDLVHFYLGASAATDNKFKRKLLDWLWKAAVQPVLQQLGFYPAIQDPLPQVYWIGVGLLAKAPIHAAAKYKTNGSLTTTSLQYYIPSYTSTIRALQYSRSRLALLTNPVRNMLTVIMPTTPREADLDVEEEADNIENIISTSSFGTVEILRRPTAEHVLQMLANYTIVHFACHGVSSVNPADSHLLLLKTDDGGGGSMEEVDKLRVKDIAAQKLPAARLAYLSACSTAKNDAEKLADEVTHIVSSFHIAGYIDVIGTLWQSEDDACKRLAVDFYSMHCAGESVAVAYRNAVMGLQKQKPSQPLYWAPFIHFGA